MQGAGTIFSRPLALLWDERMRRAIALGFADPTDRGQIYAPPPDRLPTLPTKDAIEQLCEASDAPAWIIAPVERGSQVPPGIQAILWPNPVPEQTLLIERQHFVWHRIDAYAVIRCAS